MATFIIILEGNEVVQVEGEKVEAPYVFSTAIKLVDHTNITEVRARLDKIREDHRVHYDLWGTKLILAPIYEVIEKTAIKNIALADSEDIRKSLQLAEQNVETAQRELERAMAKRERMVETLKATENRESGYGRAAREVDVPEGMLRYAADGERKYWPLTVVSYILGQVGPLVVAQALEDFADDWTETAKENGQLEVVIHPEDLRTEAVALRKQA